MAFLLPHILNSSSDEDDEVQRVQHTLERKNPFTDLDEIEFKKRFRLSKESCNRLFALIGNQIQPTNKRNYAISAMNQILITLRYYATATFQINVGDLFAVSQPTVSRIVHRVTKLIAQLRGRYISIPQNQQHQNEVVQKFYNIRGFPRVIGAIDCTHVKIISPGGENAEIFRNRKGYFSINVQAVCDADLKIMDIVASWPGSTHDMTIFNDSLLRARIENQEFQNLHLLGDNGYGCRRYLLTPLLNPATPAQRRYNESHISTRNTIEITFGVLKRRFPCLSVGMNIRVNTVLMVIVATCAS